MRKLKLKPEFSGTVQTLWQPSWAAQTKPMLLVERLTGAMLVGIAVAVLIGNALIGFSLLFRGPAFILEVLARLNC
jgi:hypothetical protein